MADHNSNHGEGRALTFALGVTAGALIGAGVALLLAPKEGTEVRREIRDRAKRLRDEAEEQVRHFGEVASELTDRGRDVAERAGAAAAAGLREIRRNVATPSDPGRAELAGVEGTGEHI